MKNIREPTLVTLAVIPAALLAFAVGRASSDAPVQYASGDLLSIFFHDARQVIGQSFVDRADSYYHGGITMDCDELTPHVHARDHGHDHGHGHDHDHGHDHGHGHEAAPQTLRDPWAWMNSHLRVQEHRHLAGEEVEEIIPWVWAACRAAPDNVEAYNIGWYVLARMRNKVDAGIEVLEEGVRNNPDSLDLAFTLGQSLYSDRKDKAAAEAAFLETRAKALRKSGGDLANLSEDDARIFVNALSYLSVMATERGELDKVGKYCAEAETAAPDYAVTHGMRARLDEE